MPKFRNKKTTVYREGTIIRGTDNVLYKVQRDGPAPKRITPKGVRPTVWVKDIVHEPALPC